ncbi:unnamed protein product [Linum tenue]|uniref:Uncharacterized protein n=1 Tax=Linum tenue TaxID=586396 RepID=A0AAV0KQE7_9ROSI|nr:unnamed protein product [Linum tenue]
MAAFSLTSNGSFIRTFRNSPDICVFDCQDDPSSFDAILSPPSHWTFRARIGDSAQYTALELFGTTIQGDELTQLAADLTLKSNSQTFYLIVNREGLCFLSVGDPVVKRIRVNDYFGWSKYGVKPVTEPTVWNKMEMFSRGIVVDFEEMARSLSESRDREAELSRSLVSKKEELESCKSELVAKQRELSGLEAILEQVRNNGEAGKKEMKEEAGGVSERESAWKKVAGEKEAELRRVERQLVGKMKHADALKGAVNSLISSMWDLNKVLRQEIICYRLLSSQGGGDRGEESEEEELVGSLDQLIASSRCGSNSTPHNDDLTDTE